MVSGVVGMSETLKALQNKWEEGGGKRRKRRKHAEAFKSIHLTMDGLDWNELAPINPSMMHSYESLR